MFQRATRNQSKLRMTIDGPAGSGKTYTALRFAHALAGGEKIAVIDTERGSASKYVGEAPDGIPWEFDTLQLTTFGPDRYTEAIQAAGRAGYSVLVVDSLSHAWEGAGGALDMKGKAPGNDYTQWRTITPIHNRMVDTILQAPLHIITTMRSRMDYVMETNEQGKITGIRKVGLAPVQRPGMEYEFDLVCDIDWNHILYVSKSRCSAVADARVEKPGPAFLQPVMDWLNSGVPQHPDPVFQPAASPEPELSLNDIVGIYGAEAVMAANGGKIPETSEELQIVVDKLIAGIS